MGYIRTHDDMASPTRRSDLNMNSAYVKSDMQLFSNFSSSRACISANEYN
jgi:hypothetical protein